MILDNSFESCCFKGKQKNKLGDREGLWSQGRRMCEFLEEWSRGDSGYAKERDEWVSDFHKKMVRAGDPEWVGGYWLLMGPGTLFLLWLTVRWRRWAALRTNLCLHKNAYAEALTSQFDFVYRHGWASLVAQWYRIRCIDSWVKKIPLEKEIATHSSILVWEIPWKVEPGGLQSMGSQKSWTQLSN